MDEQSSCSLSRKRARSDLVAVDQQLESLDNDVADEERAKRLAGRVPCHPVDHAETDERGADVAREDLRLYRGTTQAEARKHRGGEDEEAETESDRGDAADHEGEARAHGAESRSRT